MAKGIPRIATGNTMGTTLTDVDGIGEVMEMLRVLSDVLPTEYMNILTIHGTKISLSAQSKIHSISGDLAGSIKVERKFVKDYYRVSVAAGGQKAPHAHLVEFGHRMLTHKGEVIGDVPAKPFLRSAFEEDMNSIVSDIENALNNYIP